MRGGAPKRAEDKNRSGALGPTVPHTFPDASHILLHGNPSQGRRSSFPATAFLLPCTDLHPPVAFLQVTVQPASSSPTTPLWLCPKHNRVGGGGADHNTMDRVQGFPIHLYRRQRLLRGKEMHGDRGEKFSRFGVEPGPFCSSDSILKQCFSKEKGFKSIVIINLVGI